ncbi:MAG TPA: sugar phosphate isomerase/epimerase family protein [Acidobacteriaceae bacterium]|nr:sugar phosphate isomerase/epimerase family protein [Acidobacteriaceae bacterium]
MTHRLLTRRAFLATSALASASVAVPGPAFGQEKRMRVGCQANGFAPELGTFSGLLKVIDEMKALGYAGFECNIRFVSGQFAHTAEARKQLHAAGLDFIGAHIGMPKPDDTTFPDDVKGVAQLGAANIVMSAAGLDPNGKFTPEALHAKCARLDAFGKVCRDHGLQLAYHNHMPEFANSNAEIDGIADNTDHSLVHFLIDAGHGYQGGGDPAQFMLGHHERIVGCHVKTFKNHTQQVPLGEGDFGFEALAAAMRKTGWTGWVIDEEGNGKPTGGNAPAVAADRKYIRRVFGV